jgi:hypothetical protein
MPDDHLERIHSGPHGRVGGRDFFTVEVLTWRGLVTYFVLFFLQLETRRLTLGGVTQHPTTA